MNLFLDTNVFLSFYRFTSEDLEELKKLVVLIDRGTVRLWVPKQVEIEFRRNRDKVLVDSLSELRKQKFSFQFPALCRDYSEFEKLRNHQKEYEKKHKELVEKIESEVQDENLKADIVINQLFGRATKIPLKNEILSRARLRRDVGNPPGKRGARESIGDQINWESLLAKIPNDQQLYFVTNDEDYRSPISKFQFNSFLLGEWFDRKGDNLEFYERISNFFAEHFPDVKLAIELEKELLIDDLARSSSFAGTHRVVRKLNRITDFTPAQVDEIAIAALSNYQVSAIIDDSDVKGFLTKLVDGYMGEVDSGYFRVLIDKLGKNTSELDE